MRKTAIGIGITILVVGLVVMTLSLVNLPQATTEPYDVPKSSSMINESFTVPPSTVTRTASLVAGDTINIQIEVTSGGAKDINFNLNNVTLTFISVSRITTYNRNWTVPSTGAYLFVYDNSFSTFTSKQVTTQVTKLWTEVAYRDITKYHPLLPYEFVYLGLLLLLAGIGVIAWGFIRK
jgi:FlaG/FlaF family flagellin (archaellin)